MDLIVNGERVEEAVIKQEAERLRPNYEEVFKEMGAEEREAQLLDWSRENLVERVLINQEAKRYDVEIPESKIESAFEEMSKRCGDESFGKDEKDREKIKKDIELQFRVEQMMRDVCKDVAKPSEDKVCQYYEENKEQFEVAEHIKVGHIVKHVNGQADEKSAEEAFGNIYDKLKDGAVYEVVASEESDCPDNAGDLGYITRGQMVEEFEDVVFNLSIGEVSDVFKTRFGFHIAKVYDRKPATVQSLEEVSDYIVNVLNEQVQRKVIEDFVDDLKSKAKIEDV